MASRRLGSAAILAGLTALSFVAAPAAHAYIDPGSGSYLIQVILGAVFGVGVAIATFWQRMTGLVGRLFGRKPPAEPGPVPAQEQPSSEGS